VNDEWSGTSVLKLMEQLQLANKCP